ncbi:MAG: GldG family protein [Treponema sp.]|jgi:ABC-type uncharacterized transport system involved in gliding motility auxiliary subunit|nr:GldG family protein [Treponema sp.]
MNRKQASVLTLLSIVSFILAILISQRLWFRLDMTKSKAYTISAVSRNLYTEIPEEVRITYFISDKLKSVHPIPGEIEDLLREYAAFSHGRIRLFVKDPVKANLVSAVEDLGIAGQQIETVEKDQSSIAVVYTGILIEYLDRAEVLPVVFSLSTLEYDLTSRIRSLVRGVEREAGVLVGDAGKQWNRNYPYLNQAMVQSGYRVRMISPGDEISAGLPVLIVLGGMEDLDAWDLYRIDHYIQRGGKVFFVLEALSIETEGSMNVRPIQDRGLLSMVSSYGVKVAPRLVLDRASLSVPFQTTNRNGLTQIRIVPYPFWVSIPEQFGNQDHPVSAGFAGADLFWANPLELAPPQGVTGTPLFTSTPDAWLMTENFTVNPDEDYRFSDEEEITRGTRNLAAALSGKMPSFFAGKPRPVREEGEEELPPLPGEAKETRMVVIGDLDLSSEFIQFSRSQRNLDFCIKVLDWLGNDDDIIGIRNRSAATGPMDKIIDPVKKAAATRFVRVFNTLFIPAVIVVLGFFINIRRRKATSGTARKSDVSVNQGENGGRE